MYQAEIEQPTQMGIMKPIMIQKIAEQNGQKRFPVAPETPFEQIGQENKIEKEHLMSNIKGLMCQVQNILMGQEQNYGMTEQEELLRQIKDLQCQVKGLILDEQKQCMIPQCNTQEYPIHKFEITGECQPIKCEKTITGEKLRQMIEKLILQCKIFEDMLVEKQCQIVYQMPKMEQFYFDLEFELFEQIKKLFFEFEKICCDQQIEQRNMFVLIKQYIQQIEEIMCPMTGMKFMIKTKEQCERILEKMMKFRCLLEEICMRMCQETFGKRCNGIENNKMDDITKYAWLRTEYCGEQQASNGFEYLKRELNDIEMTKQHLEMRLNETNKRLEQFKRQIEMLEKMPRKQCEQYTGEYMNCGKPEEEMIQICMTPIQKQQQQQPTWYTMTAEPKCEMMIKSRIGEPRQTTTRFY